MLKIRLTRRGKKNKAFFRVVVAEHTAPIKGKFIEVLGYVDPHTKEKELKADRIKYWLSKGAQCSDSVHNLLVSNEIVKGPKRAVKIKQKAKEEAKEEVKQEKPAEEAKTEEAKAEEKKEEARDEEEGKNTDKELAKE